MSEEEIKAIDRLKYALIYDRESISSLMGFNDIKIVLQLVNKQQKEIEELKKDKKALVDNYNKVLGSFISKDKIREKLNQIYEEYQKILSSNRNLQEKNIATFQYNAMRTVLEELLQE